MTKNEEQRVFPFKIAVVYVRVSTDDQKDGFSIPAQIELLVNYARDNNIKIIRIFEESMSAKDSGRIEFNKMLKYLKLHPEVSSILVEKTDRLYRNFKDYATLDDNTYEIHLVKENEILSKDSTSHQKLVHGLKVLLAKNFIDNLREETYKGRRKKAEEGYIVGNCPYGFKKTDKLTAVVIPEQGEFIKKAFNYYASGLSLQQTRDKLADEGIVYRENCPRISRGHLHRLLQNHYYTGRVPFEDQIYEGKFETIVPIELFNKVQVMLTREKSNLKDYLFTGLIRCTRCGCLVTAELRKGIYTYYHCGGGGSRKCKQRSIHLTEDYVDRAFQRALDKISVPEERFLYLSKMLKTEMKSVHVIDTKGKDYLDEELLRLNEFASKLYQDRIDGKINEEFWTFKNKEIMEKIETCKGKLSKMSVTQVGTFDEAMAKVHNIALIPEMYRNGGWEIKKQLARLCFSKVFLKGRILSFGYAMPFKYFVLDDLEVVDKYID